jgi:hypothetical protein
LSATNTLNGTASITRLNTTLFRFRPASPSMWYWGVTGGAQSSPFWIAAFG